MGPAALSPKALMSPVEELHSLNFVSKVREYSRIDEENERLIQLLSQSPTSVQNRAELIDHWEKNKQILRMIGKKGKIGIEEASKSRDHYLKK